MASRVIFFSSESAHKSVFTDANTKTKTKTKTNTKTETKTKTKTKTILQCS